MKCDAAPKGRLSFYATIESTIVSDRETEGGVNVYN